MAFVVVHFLETDEVAIISQSWLVDRNTCKWPPYENQILIKRALLEKQAPDSNWKSCEIFILGVHKTYAGAKKEVDLALHSDSDGDDKTPERKSQKVDAILNNSASCMPIVIVKSEHSACCPSAETIFVPQQSVELLSTPLQCNSITESENNSEVIGIDVSNTNNSLNKVQVQYTLTSSAVGIRTEDSAFPFQSLTNSSLENKTKSFLSEESCEKARKKARKAEDTSCLETTDDEMYVQRKKKRNKRESNSSSCDEESRCNEDEVFSVSEFPSASQHVFSSDERPPLIIYTREEPESSANSEVNLSSSHKCCEKEIEFREKVFKMLEDIFLELKCLKNEVKNLQRPNVAVAQENDDETPTEFFFPIRNQEELDKMEALANVPEIRMKMVKFLSRVGGLTYKDVTYNIMSRVLTPEISISYSFCGKKGKQPFRSLALCNAVISAVMMCAQDSTQTDVERRIGTFLATAKDRNGGRKARYMKKDQFW